MIYCKNKNINILFIEFITSFGGVQSVLLRILPRLAKFAKVYFLDALQTGFENLLKGKNINIINMPVYPRWRALGWNKKYKRIFILIIVGPFYLIYLFRLKKLINKYRINILYTNSKKGLIFCVLLSFIKRIKIIYHMHGLKRPSDVSLIYKFLMNKSSKIIAVSKHTKTYLVSAGIKDEKIEIVYNGVPFDEDKKNIIIMKDTSCLRGNNKFIILIASSIQYNKGIHVAIEAIKELKKLNYKVELWIAGDVPYGGDLSYLKMLEKMIDKLGLWEDVHLLGWVNNIYTLIEMSDVVILPSIEEESFGLILAEAMALKKPVIGTNIGGIPEIIENEECGFIVKPEDPYCLAEKIGFLIENKSLGDKMGNNGRNRVQRLFNIEDQVNKIYKIIENIAFNK